MEEKQLESLKDILGQIMRREYQGDLESTLLDLIGTDLDAKLLLIKQDKDRKVADIEERMAHRDKIQLEDQMLLNELKEK